MILYTFLEQRDLSGKTIIPFCTHGGSGFSRTIETIRKKQLISKRHYKIIIWNRLNHHSKHMMHFIICTYLPSG